MAYQTSVPTTQLAFSDGFKYYGPTTVLTVTATVNTPVPAVTHSNGETLTDGQVLPAQPSSDFRVPATRGNGWWAPDGSHINGWTYDVAVTITATGKPPLLWSATINPRQATETITPGMGDLLGAATGNDITGAVPVTSGPLGNRWVFLGDSITQASHQNENNYNGQSFPLWAQMSSGGRIWMARNAGVAGNTSAQMLARFDTDVTPYEPQVVFLMAGTNDITTNTAFDTYRANVETIRAKCSETGAALALSTIAPNSNNTHKPNIVKWNHWLRKYATDHNLPLFDSYKTLVDPATGNIRAEYNSDGVHPNFAGLRALGSKIAEELAPMTRRWSPPLVQDNADTTTNLFSSNALLLADTTRPGVPDGWFPDGGSAGYAHKMAVDPAVPGRMAMITQTANTDLRMITRSPAPSTWSPGDRLYFAGVVTSDGGAQVSLKLTAWDGVTAKRSTAAIIDGAVTRGLVGMEVVVPGGAISVTYEFQINSGTGVASLGQPTILNLTRLGMV